MYQEAQKAIANQQWDKAAAYASAGTLSLLIGAFKAMEALGIATEHS